jgi:glycosyltransferase involved in cell wall biosynthesis
LSLCARLGSHFIAISQEIYSSLALLGVPAGRRHFSINGIDVDPGRAPMTPVGLRTALGWNDATILAVIGRLNKVKGHGYLFQAMASLCPTNPGLRCLVVGEGEERPALETMVATLSLKDRVRFVGFRYDVPSILRECDALCVPSLWEGMPYVALEATVQGIPIIATKVGDLPTVFTHGRTARLVPTRDVDALCAEIDWLLHHPKEARVMAKVAQKTVLEKFTPERMLADTLAVYDS